MMGRFSRGFKMRRTLGAAAVSAASSPGIPGAFFAVDDDVEAVAAAVAVAVAAAVAAAAAAASSLNALAASDRGPATAIVARTNRSIISFFWRAKCVE
jgi:hypothetical protein